MPRQSLASIFGVADPRPPLAAIFGPSPRDDDEDRFRAWYAERAKRLNLDPNPDDPRHHYDYRAAFRAGAEPNPETGHWPSTFKADDHPNRYVGILDTKTGQPREIPGGEPAYDAPVPPRPAEGLRGLIFASPEELAARRAGGKRAVAALGDAVAAVADLPAIAGKAIFASSLPSGVQEPSFDELRTLTQPGVIGRARRAVSAFDERSSQEQLDAEIRAGRSPLRAAAAEYRSALAGNVAALALPADLGAGRLARGVAGAARGARVAEEAGLGTAKLAEEAAQPLAAPAVKVAERRANPELRAGVDAALARLREAEPSPAELADIQAQAVEAGDRATEVATERYAHDLGSGHFAPPAGRPSLDEILGEGAGQPEGPALPRQAVPQRPSAPVPPPPSSAEIGALGGVQRDSPAALTPERASRLTEAEGEYRSWLRFADSHHPEEAAKTRKAAGMRFAAAKRQILGNLTAKEEAAKAGREASAYLGKPVLVEGRPAEVVGNPYGRVKVRFEDGTERVVEREALGAAPARPEEPAATFAPPPRRAVTERGTAIDFDYEVRDASDLVTSHDVAMRPRPDYPVELQPRDRSRLASEAQVDRIERQLNPELLGESPHASTGAPIVGPDGIVESGNARSIALQRAYRRGGESVDRYRGWLEANAPRFGVDPVEVAARREPVLVRVRRTPVDRAAFAAEANEAPLARMSATEQAAADAQRITPAMLDSLRIPESGEVNFQANRDFVRAFTQQVPTTEVGAMYDARGLLSAEGHRRLQNAVLARAYGDADAVAQLVEHADSNVRGVGNALFREAPRFARLREDVAAGQLHPLDVSDDIGAALRKLSALRQEGAKVPDYLAQGGLFGAELTPESRALLAIFDANGRSSARVAGILDRYASLAEGMGHPEQAGLFGGRAVPSKLDLLREALAEDPDQAGLFALAEPPAGSSAVEAELGQVPPPAPRPVVRDGLFLGQEEPPAPPVQRPEPPLGPRRLPEPPVESEPLPGMEPPPPGLTTGTKHAVTRAERLARGLPEVERVAAKGSETWAEAKAIYERDPPAARDLAQRIAADPRRVPSDLESDILGHDRMTLTLDHRDALATEAEALARGDKEAAALAGIRRRSLEEAFAVSDTALDRGGTAWSRAGSARRKLIAEDYSPIHLTQRYRVANEGVEAPEPVRQKLTEISAQLEAAQARAAAAEERAQELEALRVIRSEQGAAARAGRSGQRAVTRQALDAEYSALSQAFAKRAATPRAGLDPELAGLIAKMAKNRVRAVGTTSVADLVDGIYQETKPYLADLEPRDVRDAIAGAGPTAQKAARSQAVSELARVRREARVLNALDDARAKLANPRLAPAARPALEREVARWEGEMEKLGAGTAPPGVGPASDPQRLSAAKGRAAQRIVELQEQIASGAVLPKGRAPVAADAELLNARAQVNGLQHQADAIIRRREMANRGKLEKALDWTAGWGRFLKLSGLFVTPQKLFAAIGSRTFLIRPIEEMIGGGVSKLPVVTHFAAEAPVEGGGSLSAIAKSYGAFFGKQAREEAMGILRTGEGPLDASVGKFHDSGGKVPEWMEYPGRGHGALKAPGKVAAYQYAMEKQAKWYLDRGEPEELLNPLSRAEMHGRAVTYAQSEIYMGDHELVAEFQNALRDRPGQSPTRKIVTTAIRTELPIVKVPVNYVTDLTHYAVGVPRAAGRMGRVVVKGRRALEKDAAADLGTVVREGLKQLPPGEADEIMRQLKKGLLGNALLTLSAAGVIEAGGYWKPGDHRRKGDLQAGEIRVAGRAVPHMILHQGAFEIIQAGGAIHREKEIADGLNTAFWGGMEQVPFYETPARSLRTIRDDPSQPVGDWLRGMTIPPDVQRLARVLDQRGEHDLAEKVLQETGWEHIDARKRKARGGFLEQLGEEEMLGLPVARGHVR